ARLLLIEIDGNDLEAKRRAVLERQQNIEQRVTVLAAGQADHDAIAGFDHREITDRLADLAAQAFFELVGLELDLARIAHASGRHVDRAPMIFHVRSLTDRPPSPSDGDQPNGRSRVEDGCRTLALAGSAGAFEEEASVQTIVIANPK